MAFDPAHTKSVLTSVTILGAALTALAGIFPHFFQMMFGTTSTAVIAQDISIIVSMLIAWWGRIRATQPVTLTGAPAVPPVKTPGVG